MEYESIILVTRGDEMPKKNFEKKLHPTYECLVRLKGAGTSDIKVTKFFDQYRTLSNDLNALGVGENQKIQIDAKFPPSQSASMFGISMSEDALQQRCYLLNKWMGALLTSFYLLPPEAKEVVSKFFFTDDEDVELEANKVKVLELIQKKKSDIPKHIATNNTPSVVSNSSNHSDNTPPPNAKSATPAPLAVQQSTQSVNNGAGIAAVEPDREPTPSVMSSSPAENRRGSTMGRRVSVGSTAEVFSPLEIEIMAKENVFNTYLAVQVIQGEMIPKRAGESKLHISFQTTLRLLSFDDFNLPNKGDVDAEAYNALGNFIRPIVLTKTFDSYRNLKENLEKANVFCVEASSNPEGALVLEAPFPKTYAKSAMGMVLTEAQINLRVAMLNNWMARVLAAYCTLSGSAQNLINTFFSIASQIPSDVHYDIFLKMLQKNFVPTKKPHHHHNQEAGAAEKSKFSLFSKTSSSQPAANNPPPPPAASNDNAVIDPDEEYDGKRQSVVTTVFNMNELSDMSKEQIIKSFLGVCVIKSEKMEDNKKLHHAYKTIVRILPSNEVLGYDMGDVDLTIYNKYSSYTNNFTLSIFDNYRSLKTALQTCLVYSQDTASQAPKNRKCVVINAPFPKTYPKSKLGIGLTEAELKQRTSLLNHWMCVMLSLFNEMPEQAQEKVIQFLSLDEDNPAEPQNRIIQQMLRGTFKPPKKVVVAASTSGKAKGPVKKYTQGEDEEDDRERGTGVTAGAKGCCVIM